MKKIIILLTMIFLLLACSPSNENQSGNKLIDPRKPMAWGHPQTIYVFTDNNIWKYAETPLRENLERFYFTTENEKYFDIKRIEYKQLEQFYKFNNLIFFADYSSAAEVSAYVKELLGDTGREAIKGQGAGIFPQNNLWANDQFVLFLAADSEENLLRLNILQANKVFELFQNKLFQRISHKVYKQKIYSEQSFQGKSWLMDIPKNYLVYKEDIANNFISYLARLRNKPDRYISVYHENMDINLVDKDWIKAKRAELAWKYYDEDVFDEDNVKVEISRFGDYPCWKLSGKWQNKKYLVGGAFQSFAFYDTNTKTAFLIDNSIYFPEGYKLSGLIETEVISRSFRIKE